MLDGEQVGGIGGVPIVVGGSRLRFGRTPGRGSPIALVHRLHPGNRDLVPVRHQVSGQLLRRRQLIGPTVRLAEQGPAPYRW